MAASGGHLLLSLTPVLAWADRGIVVVVAAGDQRRQRRDSKQSQNDRSDADAAPLDHHRRRADIGGRCYAIRRWKDAASLSLRGGGRAGRSGSARSVGANLLGRSLRAEKADGD